MKKYIPNTLTCLNLFSGCMAVVTAFDELYVFSLFFILISAVFDFFDGYAARHLHAFSVIGKDLDSLADLVSFGMAPAAMMMSLLARATYPNDWVLWYTLIPPLAFLITVFSALRLARFNHDERQHDSFIGLATPANALLLAGLVNMIDQPGLGVVGTLCGWPNFFHTMHTLWLSQPWVLLVVVVLSCYLLVSPIPMFSLKKSGLLPKVFVPTAVLLSLCFGFTGLTGSMLCYVLISVGLWLRSK